MSRPSKLRVACGGADYHCSQGAGISYARVHWCGLAWHSALSHAPRIGQGRGAGGGAGWKHGFGTKPGRKRAEPRRVPRSRQWKSNARPSPAMAPLRLPRVRVESTPILRLRAWLARGLHARREGEKTILHTVEVESTQDTTVGQSPKRLFRSRQATIDRSSRLMTLQCWNTASPRKAPSAIETSESLLLSATNQDSHMGRGRATPRSARCRSQSSNWDKDAMDNSGESEDDHFDATSATLPAPSHQIHAMPALWISGRRRHNRARSRRRTVSENYTHANAHGSGGMGMTGCSSHPTPTDSSFPTLPSSLSGGDEQLREAVAAAAAGESLNERLRITSPDGPGFTGWVRGQAADVQWASLDPSVQCVRIDVCNVAWTVPTTIAHRVANDGMFRWRRVYWGMPIAEGYYVNIYDVTEQKDPTDSMLLAQSERFAVIK